MKNRPHDPWRNYRRRATEGVATWMSRLPGGVAAYLPDGGSAERLHAFVRDTVTTNPMTREPLAPVQLHLLELVLEAVDWPAIAIASELRAEAGATATSPGPGRGGPS